MTQFGFGRLLLECRWAWRGVRARRGQGLVVLSLLSLTLAANAVVFAAADAFVFRPLPYKSLDGLVVLGRQNDDAADYLWPSAIDYWRQQHDLFGAVEAHARTRSVYLTAGGVTEAVPVELVTPGLFEMVGVSPAWGRPLKSTDLTGGGKSPVLIAESLARRMFGKPAAAVDQTIVAGSEQLQVVGVMPEGFIFPGARQQVWRLLDLSAWPVGTGVGVLARVQHGGSRNGLAQVLSARGLTDPIRVRPIVDAFGYAGAASSFRLLLGAAGCLLLIACANVASLELAAAGRRRRSHAVQTALGASMASLVRVNLLEGAVLVGASAIAGLVLANWGLAFVGSRLTPGLQGVLAQPLALGGGAMAFILAAAVVTWGLIYIPSIRRVSHLAISEALREDSRASGALGRESKVRRFLLAGQVAMTTLLLVSGLLYLGSFRAEANLDKGFDGANVATIEVLPVPGGAAQPADLESSLLTRLRSIPWIVGAARTDTLPPDTTGGGGGRLNIDGRNSTAESVMINMRDVDPEYFATMGLTVIEGRPFDALSAQGQIVVDERFARRYWAGQSAVGATFTLGRGMGLSGASKFEIVGVSRQSYNDRLVNERGDQIYVAYIRVPATYHPLKFVARIDRARRLTDLAETARALAGPNAVVRVDTIETRYGRLYADIRLAAAVTGSFGLVALLVATAGIYSVTAFLAAARTREIAIRLALGAEPSRVLLLVCRGALAAVLSGTLVGVVGAFVGWSWVQASIAGIPSARPSTYLGAIALILLASLAGVWWPAWRASLIDPATTLARE
jgi:predicted permease